MNRFIITMVALLLGPGPALADSIDQTSNENFISGSFTPETQTHAVKPGTEALIGAFRGRKCGRAPDFSKLMEQQIEQGMQIPADIIVFNGGVTEYKSRSCEGAAKARVIGVRLGKDFAGDELIFRFEHRGRQLKFVKKLDLAS